MEVKPNPENILEALKLIRTAQTILEIEASKEGVAESRLATFGENQTQIVQVTIPSRKVNTLKRLFNSYTPIKEIEEYLKEFYG